MPVFAARGLTKTYRMGETEIHALRGVDLEIDAGEFIVLLGPSGSGKSTLRNNFEAMVVDDLKAGDRVVVYPSDALKDNSRVEVRSPR